MLVNTCMEVSFPLPITLVVVFYQTAHPNYNISPNKKLIPHFELTGYLTMF